MKNLQNLLQKYGGYILIGLGIILLFFTLGCCPNSCKAQDVQYSTTQRWVTDNEDLYTAEEEKALSQICSDFEKQTTCEIAILTTDNLEGYGDISEYATFVGQKWGVGKDSLDNGLMIVISAKLRKAFAATGYGLEGYLPDITVNRLIDNAMPHHFKNKEYFAGTKEFLDGVTTTLGPNFQYSATENKDKIESSATTETTESGFGILWIIIIIVFIVIVAVILAVSGALGGGGGGYSGGYSGYDSSSSSSSFSSGDSGGFGGGDFGGGGGGTDW